jgi:hypothetical protein
VGLTPIYAELSSEFKEYVINILCDIAPAETFLVHMVDDPRSMEMFYYALTCGGGSYIVLFLYLFYTKYLEKW